MPGSGINERWWGVAIAAGGLAAALGSVLNWVAFPSPFGEGIGGLRGPEGTRALWLGIACALIGSALVLLRQASPRAALSAVAVLCGAIGVWMPVGIGLRVEPAVGIGIYLASAGAVVVVIAAATILARSLGMPEPSFSRGVGVAFTALGVFGWIFNSVAAQEIRDAGASRFLITCVATLLLVSGLGILARQTWAWLLAIALSTVGILGNAFVVISTEGPRAPYYLAAFMYFYALRALWRARGHGARAAAEAGTEQPTAVASSEPVLDSPAATPPVQPAVPALPSREARAVSPEPEIRPPPVPPLPAVDAPAPARSPGTSPAYVKRCLQPAYFEEPESRTWQSDPSLRAALDPLNAGDNRRAATEAEKITQRLPDFDLGYSWGASALLRMGDHHSAREIVLMGLRRSKRKFVLLQLLGEIEWKAGNLEEAVYAWSQAVHCQELLERYGGDVGSYLHLHYVAEGAGLREVAAAFVARVDSIRFGEIRLEPAAAADLTVLARAHGDGVSAVLRGLYDRYLKEVRNHVGA